MQIGITSIVEGNMAFTFRATEDHNNILDVICKKNGFNARAKALSWLIESYPDLASSRDCYLRKMQQTSAKLTELRRAVTTKLIADQNLERLVAESETDDGNSGGMVDE
jgi:hypothetical protein